MTHQFMLMLPSTEVIKVRVLEKHETVTSDCFVSPFLAVPCDIDWYFEHPECIERLNFIPTEVAGDLVCLHPERIYIKRVTEESSMWQSNAEWPVGVCSTPQGNNISTDTHHNKKGAEAVCKLLEEKGFGGEGKYFPIRTWVSTFN